MKIKRNKIFNLCYIIFAYIHARLYTDTSSHKNINTTHKQNIKPSNEYSLNVHYVSSFILGPAI